MMSRKRKPTSELSSDFAHDTHMPLDERGNLLHSLHNTTSIGPSDSSVLVTNDTTSTSSSSNLSETLSGSTPVPTAGSTTATGSSIHSPVQNGNSNDVLMMSSSSYEQYSDDSISIDTAARSNSSSSCCQLSVRPAWSRTVVADKVMELRVYLVGSDGRSMKMGHHIDLQVSIIRQDTNQVLPCEQQRQVLQLQWTDTNKPVIAGTGYAKLCTTFSDTLASLRGKELRVQITGTSTDPITIEPFVSDTFCIVRYRLLLDCQPPELWHKDEGGKEKTMQIQGRLVNYADTPILPRTVRLHITLLYANSKTEVKDQSILRIKSSSSSLSNGGTSHTSSVQSSKSSRGAQSVTVCVNNNGRFDFCFRIEEVSKNHQKQAFCVQISPDLNADPLNSDIANVTTSSVLVRSKRSKRNKKLKRQGSESSVMSSSTTSDHSALTMQSNLPIPSDIPPSAISQHASVTAASLQLLEQTEMDDAKQRSVLASLGDFGACVQEVSSFCQYAIKELASLEWQLVGYELNADHSLDFRRPIVRCPACHTYRDAVRQPEHADNCCIANIMHRYQNNVHRSLDYIVNSGAQVTSSPLSLGALGSLGAESPEALVRAVMMTHTSFGYPAFDEHHILVGFFKLDILQNMSFVVRSTFDTVEAECTFQDLTASYQDILRSAFAEPTSQILTLADCVTLDNLKEHIVLHHFAAVSNFSNFLV
jgi:hypothetical protein